MSTSKAKGAIVAQMGLVAAGLRDGDASFFSCPTEGCNAAVAGKCGVCGGLWSWCGCGDNRFDCPCGLNAERGSPAEAARLLQRRVVALEEAIRAHRGGRGPTPDADDLRLYALLDEGKGG